MIIILKKELNTFLNSLIGYLVIIIFLLSMGLLIWVFPKTSVLNYGYADLETLFSLGPYIFMFLIPAITMRMFSEEKKTGTIELLLTKPFTDWDIILGKYFSGILLIILSLLPTGLYYFSLYELGTPKGNLDTAGILGSYIGLISLGSVFTAIGLLTSLFTTNQIVSFILAVFCCFISYTGFESIASINVWSDFSYILEQLGLIYHYRAMSKGLLDSRNLIYFISLSAAILMVAKMLLEKRK